MPRLQEKDLFFFFFLNAGIIDGCSAVGRREGSLRWKQVKEKNCFRVWSPEDVCSKRGKRQFSAAGFNRLVLRFALGGSGLCLLSCDNY